MSLGSSPAPQDRAGHWWVFLVTGAGWILLSLALLEVGFESRRAIAAAFGAVALTAGINEFGIAAAQRRWRWGHGALGVLFVVAAMLAWLWPAPSYPVLTGIVGWCLLIKGTFDVIVALAQRQAVELWWLRVTVGVVELLLALSVVAYPGESTALLALWVGLSAMLRGITEIVLAFGAKEVACAAPPALALVDNDGGNGAGWPANPVVVRSLTSHSVQDYPYQLPAAGSPDGHGARGPVNGEARPPYSGQPSVER